MSFWRDGFWTKANRLDSPNKNNRPNIDVSLIVIHNISLPAGRFATGHIEQLFCNTLDTSLHESYASLHGVEVSAHFLIHRTGRVTQFVSCDERAWHAGLSTFEECDNCNDFSIGIELEGTDHLPYEAEQYNALAELVIDIMKRYPSIKKTNIVGHCDIAPGRKTDPGPSFNWTRFYQQVFKL